MLFTDWIRNELTQRGWSQATLAQHAGLSLSTIRRVLVMGRQPGMRFFVGIATAFEISVVEVIVIWEQTR